MVLAISLTISAVVAIIAGIVILIWPKSLNLAVAFWLILYGILEFTSPYY
jgi:hypothetical protein